MPSILIALIEQNESKDWIIFVAGMITGAILAFAYIVVFTNRVLKSIEDRNYSSPKKEDDKKDDGDYWKPKGWRPDD